MQNIVLRKNVRVVFGANPESMYSYSALKTPPEVIIVDYSQTPSLVTTILSSIPSLVFSSSRTTRWRSLSLPPPVSRTSIGKFQEEDADSSKSHDETRHEPSLPSVLTKYLLPKGSNGWKFFVAPVTRRKKYFGDKVYLLPVSRAERIRVCVCVRIDYKWRWKIKSCRSLRSFAFCRHSFQSLRLF